MKVSISATQKLFHYETISSIEPTSILNQWFPNCYPFFLAFFWLSRYPKFKLQEEGTTPIVSHCATRAEFVRHSMHEAVSLNAIMTHESQRLYRKATFSEGFL